MPPVSTPAPLSAADQFKANFWGPNGTANGLTEAQNLANVNTPAPQAPKTPAIGTPMIGPILGPESQRPTYQGTPAPQSSPAGDLGNVLGQFAKTFNAMPTAAPTSTPAPMNLYQDPYAKSASDIQNEANARMDAILQAGRTSAQGSLTGLKNANDYTNQINTDNRTLRNTQFQEDNNPFSGKFAYDKTNMLRNDGIQDTSQNNQYNANVQQVNQKLADLEAAAPSQKQAIIDQLQQIERTTGISVAQLQLQQQNQQFQQGATTAGLTGQLPQSMGGGQTLAAQSQSFNQNLQTNQQNQSAQNQQFNQSQQTQQFAYTQARDAIKDKEYQQTFDLNVKQQGLDYALKQATLQNQITNDQAQRSIGYMNAQTAQKNATTTAANDAARNTIDQGRLNNENANLYGTRDKNGNQSADYLYKTSQAARDNALADKAKNDSMKNDINTAYKDAVGLAMKDPSYAAMTDDQKTAAIDSYYNRLKPAQPAAVSDSDISSYLNKK